MMLSVTKFIRKRPWSSGTAISLASLSTYSFFLEYRANQRERAHFDDPSSFPCAVLPRSYDWNSINQYWSSRPIATLKRFAQIAYEIGPIAIGYIKDFVVLPPNIPSTELHVIHAVKLRDALTNLGPAFVKAGQQLSIRPDLVPPPVLKELQKLCDSVRPVSDDIAFRMIRDELGLDDLATAFDDMKLVAAASLGQVYKARLKNGEEVAIKVQRPNMQRQFSLDLFLLRKLGLLMDTFTAIFTKQAPFHQALYDSFSEGSYLELDYENEARNQQRFQKEFMARNQDVIVPHVYTEYSSQRVLTTEWIEGVKLADSSKERIRELIPVGVELFLTQLLDIGAFHSDPHPGNLLVTKEGKLCLLDYGLTAEVDEKSRLAMTKAIVHLLMRDFDSLVSEDAKELGFLPQDFDTTEIKPLLTKILTVGLVESGSDFRNRKRKLWEISSELNEVFFRYPFSVPPFFALITRGMGLLEGIALTGDPEFDIFRASAPYARRRAVRMLGSHSIEQVRRLTGSSKNY